MSFLIFFEFDSIKVHSSRLAWLTTLLCLSGAVQAIDQPRCTIASIQLGALTKRLPMDEPEYVEGRVEVVCSNTTQHPQTVELGLFEVAIEAATGAGPATSVPPSAGLRVDLYSDEAGRQTLPLKASELRDYPTRRTIPRSGTAQLSIPFYARVVAQQLLSAGDYNFSREIGLAYRPGVVR